MPVSAGNFFSDIPLNLRFFSQPVSSPLKALYKQWRDSLQIPLAYFTHLLKSVHSVGSFSFCFVFSRSRFLSFACVIASFSFALTDGFFVLLRDLPVYSLNAAVMTSASLALKKTKYLAALLSYLFQTEINTVLFATRSKDLIFPSLISILESCTFCRISFSMVCFPR